MDDLPICDCGGYWPGQGHHPECPVRHELERLRAELAECRDALAKIGPYYVPSTELSDDEVNAMYAMIDAARKGEGEK